jgi:hypothetical protein
MWVALHIRYSGISMGKGEGYTLHPGIMTFRDRCGVCKDIAGMSITMLRAAGYTVYPTMTMAGARVERIPADQFNHCVAAVDISREGIKSDALGGRAGFEDKYDMYDATWAPNSMEVWSRYEGDQNIVIGSPEGENLTAIRPFKPEENRLNIISKATINKDGDLTGTFELVGVGGGPDTRLRRFFAYTGNKDEIWQALSNYLSKLAPGTELIGYEYSDLGDFWNPLKVRIDYRTPGYAQIYGEGLHFTSPAAEFMPATGFLRTIFRYATLEERKNPLFLYAPQDVAITEEIAVPSGYKRLSEIKPVEAGADFANFKASVEKSKIGVKLTYHYTVAERYVETSEYPQVWDITQQMKNFADQNIHIWRN